MRVVDAVEPQDAVKGLAISGEADEDHMFGEVGKDLACVPGALAAHGSVGYRGDAGGEVQLARVVVPGAMAELDEEIAGGLE